MYPIFQKDIFIHKIRIIFGNNVINLQGIIATFVGEVFILCCSKYSKLGSETCPNLGYTVNILRDFLWNFYIKKLVFCAFSPIKEGSKVYSLCYVLSVSLGDYVFGFSIFGNIGNLVFCKNRVNVRFRWCVEAPAASIIERVSVFESLSTGIISVDTIVPIGRGQRELVLGDRQTGKSSIGIDTILNQRFPKVFCVFVPIGQKSTSILEVFMSIISRDSSFFVTFLVSSSSNSAVSQYLFSYFGAGLSEFFIYICGSSVFMFIDDLSKHAGSFREISLLLRRPPGREAYPGEIFFVHSRLLERAAKLAPSLGGGSISCIPVIETLAGDLGAFIATNVIH